MVGNLFSESQNIIILTGTCETQVQSESDA